MSLVFLRPSSVPCRSLSSVASLRTAEASEPPSDFRSHGGPRSRARTRGRPCSAYHLVCARYPCRSADGGRRVPDAGTNIPRLCFAAGSRVAAKGGGTYSRTRKRTSCGYTSPPVREVPPRVAAPTPGRESEHPAVTRRLGAVREVPPRVAAPTPGRENEHPAVTRRLQFERCRQGWRHLPPDAERNILRLHVASSSRGAAKGGGTYSRTRKRTSCGDAWAPGPKVPPRMAAPTPGRGLGNPAAALRLRFVRCRQGWRHLLPDAGSNIPRLQRRFLATPMSAPRARDHQNRLSASRHLATKRMLAA